MGEIFSIESYEIKIFTHRKDSQYHIICRGTGGKDVRIDFYTSFDIIDSLENKDEKAEYQLNYLITDFAYVVDMLRSGNDVYVDYADDRINRRLREVGTKKKIDV